VEIPDFQTVMLPLLKLLSDGQEHSVSELVEQLSASFGLSEQEVKQLLPSGQRTFYNRVLWARVYLSKAGLLATPSRGNYQITDEGKNVLSQNPGRIDMKFLEQFPGYLVFKGTKKKKNQDVPNELNIESKLTPDEVFSEAYNEIRNRLSQDLLSRVKECSSFFFERLVVGLLVKMGYGDFTRENSGKAKATGGSNDGGIDGIIPQDKLGLDSVYIQAKKWENVVSRPEIQKFVGALEGVRARKGIFLTTSTFSEGAKNYVKNIDKKVVLIDGERLAELMIDNDIGVALATSYQIKKIDSDYFIDE
jgi:restriction system protein